MGQNTPSIEIRPIERNMYRLLFESQGVTGKDWVRLFDELQVRIGIGVKEHLLDGFAPTRGMRYNMVVIAGSYWEYTDRCLHGSRREQSRRSLRDATTESMCIIKAGLSKDQWEQMGLEQIIATQQPVDGLDCGDPGIPVIRAPWKCTQFFGSDIDPAARFCPGTGFALLAN